MMPIARVRSRAAAPALAAVLTAVLCLQAAPRLRPDEHGTLPDRLTDQQFWQLSSDLSEANGFFRSDNLVSNEHTFQYVVPALRTRIKPGGVYLGVAPDQNFTYILATAPQMAFIVDIRRGNLLEQLLYKAVIELSPDRAAFVSRLFSKPRPAGIRREASAAEIFDAYAAEGTREDLFRQNLRAVKDLLTRRHGFRLSPDDIAQLEDIYMAFFWDGPALRYSMPGMGARGRMMNFPTYEDLVTATDAAGAPRSYLASEAQYRALRDLEMRNLIVPVVGNFAGPKALRGVGRYVREHGGIISAFYVSNVEQYLFQDGLFDDFAKNVATLPVDDTSTFIRSVWSRFGYEGAEPLGPDGRATALYPIKAFVDDFEAGRLRSYFDVNQRSR
jgi:hypothetical protein